MNFIVLGTNHKFSPIEIREKLYFSRKQLGDLLVNLLSYQEIKASVILSTCNRVELYAFSEEIENGVATLKNYLSSYHSQELKIIEPYIYTYIGKEAILHLFNVAAGLDSQIIGESQILEQVRFFFGQAKLVEATNCLLDKIFNQAIKTSLKVRQETNISIGNISTASIALDFIKTRFGSLTDKKILIIGLGKISQLLIDCLKKEKVNAVFITNRNFEKAKELAKQIKAHVVRFDQLKEKLQDADIVISATASPHLILKREDLLDIKKPLLIIDLAVPRDIDPQAKTIGGVSLFSLEDLDFIIERKLSIRKQSIPAAMEIIKKEVENLCLTKHLEPELARALLP